jgi:aspartyl protease family protein
MDKIGFRCLMMGVLAILGVVGAEPGWAIDLAVSGISGKKVVLVIDGGAPRTVAVGQSTPEGVKVVEIAGETVTLQVDGQWREVRLGEHVVRREENVPEVWIQADDLGHFYVDGAINGRPTRFIVDTGASMVSISLANAQRMGMDLSKARESVSQTAAGKQSVRIVALESVKVGGLQLHDVEAVVYESDLPFALLGMNFLSRMEMVYEGQRLRLRRKY